RGNDQAGVGGEPKLTRAAKEASRKRGYSRPLGRLSLFATERAAQAPHLDGHRGIRQAKKPGDNVLQFAWMLGRRIDQHLVFSGNRQRHLALKIEMFLTTDPQ